MKPPDPQPDDRPTGSDQNPPAGSVPEYEADLDRLLEIESEVARLNELRERAEALKDAVTAPVFRRVLDDYVRQAASLAQETQRIDARLAEVDRQLGIQFDRAVVSSERTRLELEELEFRNTVGELVPERVVELRQMRERILSESLARMEAIAQARARLAGSVNRRPADPDRGPAEAGAGSDERSPSVPPSLHREPSHDLPPVQAGHEAKPLLFARSLERTLLASGPTESSEAPTFTLPIAALLYAGGSDARPLEHRLGPISYIGRAEDSAVQVTGPSVSRRHAVVVATPDGFVVKDLHSQNGTYVNGERIREQLLVDGDEIQIGEIALIFRSPWGGRLPRPEAL